PRVGVDDLYRGNPRGRQRIPDELGGILGPVDDVDLLAVQLGHHVADPAAERADARALGVHARLARADRDLGAVAGLAGDRRDLHRAVGDLGDLQGEQLAHEVRVRPRQLHRRAAVALADLHHVGAQPVAVLVALAGDLLLRRQDGLDPTEVDQHVPRVLALLDDAADDVALAAGVLAERQLVLRVAEALQDDLLGGGRRDTPETGRGVVVFPDLVALVVDLGRPDRDVPGLPVEFDARLRRGALRPVVGDQQGVLDGLDGHLQRDVLLALQAP